MSGFSAVNYALSKKLDNAILSGVVSHSVDNVNKTITFTFNDGTSSTIQFNNPSNGVDGVGIAAMHKDTNNHLIVSLTDGSNIDVGELPVGNATGIIKEITNITYLYSKLTFTFSDGTNRIVSVNPKLTELSDVTITSPTSGQVLVYNGATNKFINSSISTTDHYVKMTSADATGSYLADLIDNDSLINNNNKLEVNKIKGQQITVDELNTLIGMDANIKDSLNALASGGMVFKDVVPTKADLPQGALNGFVYIVNSDETDNGNRNAYIYSDVHSDYVLIGSSGLEVRDFTTNPINLETEVTGILPTSKIDTTGFVNKSTDVVSSLTYPIPDSDLNKIANLNVLKQINTEVANALNNKMDINDSEVLKKTDIATTINSTSTDDTVPSTKTVYSVLASSLKDVKIMFFEFVNQFNCSILGINSSNTITEVVRAFANYIKNNYGIGQYAILEISANSGVSDFTNSLPNKQACIITVKYTPKNQTNRVQVFLTDTINGNSYIGTLNNSDTSDIVWREVCTTTVADIVNVDVTSSFVTTVATINTIAYTIKNGICYVRVNNLKPLITCSETIILPKDTLPKASTSFCYANISSWSEGGLSTILLQPNTNGSLDLWCNSNALNKAHYGMFSYPVAE